MILIYTKKLRLTLIYLSSLIAIDLWRYSTVLHTIQNGNKSRHNGTDFNSL